MKNFRILAPLLIFLFSGFASYSQDLTIFKGSKKASFKKDQLLDVFYTSENQNPDCDYCNHKNFKGFFQEVSNDSLVFKILELHQYQTGEDVSIHKELIYHSGQKELTIAKNGIFHFKNLGSKAKSNRKQIYAGLAGVFVVGSAIAGISSLIAKGDSRKKIGFFSLAQLGVGITFATMSHQNQYSLKPSDSDPWRFE